MEGLSKKGIRTHGHGQQCGDSQQKLGAGWVERSEEGKI